MSQTQINRMKYLAAESRFLGEAAQLGAALKYSPDQPRAPAGRPEGGQWITQAGSESTDVAGVWNELNRAKCEAQYDSDMLQCSFAASARYRSACENQAMTRRNTCMKDDPIPPLIYYLASTQ
jgi:hypothetical protein